MNNPINQGYYKFSYQDNIEASILNFKISRLEFELDAEKHNHKKDNEYLLKRIKKLEKSLKTIREENNRAKRQFTNVSNKLIEKACKVLDTK